MRILLLEDLDTFAGALIESVESKRSKLGPVSIERVSSELEFRRRLPQLATESFHFAIFDVMVCWCSLEDLDTPEGKNPPPEVIEERDGNKKWRSGVRCLEMFDKVRADLNLTRVPRIFYSVLDHEDLKGELNGDTALVVKQGELAPLIQAIMHGTFKP
jgi:hypothetical protein